MGVTRGYERDYWNLLEKFGADLVFGDEDSGWNADFGTLFFYLIRRVENVSVGWVVSRV